MYLDNGKGDGKQYNGGDGGDFHGDFVDFQECGFFKRTVELDEWAVTGAGQGASKVQQNKKQVDF